MTMALDELGSQVNCLLRLLELARSENNVLHKKLLEVRKAHLQVLEKNTHAAEKIKLIVSGLKEALP